MCDLFNKFKQQFSKRTIHPYNYIIRKTKCALIYIYIHSYFFKNTEGNCNIYSSVSVTVFSLPSDPYNQRLFLFFIFPVVTLDYKINNLEHLRPIVASINTLNGFCENMEATYCVGNDVDVCRMFDQYLYKVWTFLSL